MGKEMRVFRRSGGKGCVVIQNILANAHEIAGGFRPFHVMVKSVGKSPRGVNQLFFHAVDVFFLHIMFLHFPRACIKAANIVQHVPEGKVCCRMALKAGMKL